MISNTANESDLREPYVCTKPELLAQLQKEQITADITKSLAPQRIGFRLRQDGSSQKEDSWNMCLWPTVGSFISEGADRAPNWDHGFVIGCDLTERKVGVIYPRFRFVSPEFLEYEEFLEKRDGNEAVPTERSALEEYFRAQHKKWNSPENMREYEEYIRVQNEKKQLPEIKLGQDRLEEEPFIYPRKCKCQIYQGCDFYCSCGAEKVNAQAYEKTFVEEDRQSKEYRVQWMPLDNRSDWTWLESDACPPKDNKESYPLCLPIQNTFCLGCRESSK